MNIRKREIVVGGKSGGRSWELNLNHNFMKNNDIIFWHQKYSTKYGTKKFFPLIFDYFLTKFESNPK